MRIFSKNKKSLILEIVFIYFLAGIFWIIFSDSLLYYFTEKINTTFAVNLIKGITFVIFSSLLMYFLIEQYLRIMKLNQKKAILNDLRFKAIFENVNDGVLFLSLEEKTGDAKIINCNRAFAEFVRYHPGDLINNSIKILLPEDSFFTLVDTAHSLKQNNSLLLQTRFIKSNRDTIWLELNIRKEIIDNMPRLVIIARNIEERKRFEEELVNANERLVKTLDNLAIAGFEIDRFGFLQDFRGRALRFLPYLPSEVIGRSIRDLYSTKPEIVQAISEAQSGKITKFKTYQNKRFWDVQLYPLREFKSQYSVFGTAMDITEHKKTEEDLKNSLNEKDILIQEVHHRVKNNLQIISSMLNLQLSRMEDEKLKDVFRDMQYRVRSIMLVHENLYASKKMVRVDFGEYVRSLINSMIRSFGKTGMISKEIRIQQSGLDIKNAIPCGLIISELVNNSLKYGFNNPMDATPWIGVELTYYPEKKEHILIVSDNGKGFPEDFLEKKGSLGLKLVKSLTSQLKGNVNFMNENGARVEIIF